MNLRDISLSIYSFGYAGGFIRDTRPDAAAPEVTLETTAPLAKRLGLGGIEIPIDRYFPVDRLEEADAFLAGLQRDGMRVAVDLEQFDAAYVRALLPVAARRGLGFARIKMSGFYGGNRYLEPDFAEQVQGFVRDLRGLVPALREHGVKLLIENHQDLGAEDLLEIIAATSSQWVGITWDIGNSLAVLDTPERFVAKAGAHIGNVHLKDYRLARCETGMLLCRCALGEGVVDFAGVLGELARQRGQVPLAIELGAQVARRADVFMPAYWAAYPPRSVEESMPFLSFVHRRATDAPWQSAWERGLPGQAIIAQELAEVERSVEFLSGLSLEPAPAAVARA